MTTVSSSGRTVAIWLTVSAVVGYALVQVALKGVEQSWLLAWIGYAVVGGLILVKRPGNWVGRIMLTFGAWWVAADALTLLNTGSLPVWVDLAWTIAGMCTWMLLPLLIVVYPHGRAGSDLGRWLIRAAVLAVALVVVSVLLSSAPMELSGKASPLTIDTLAPLAVWFVSGAGFVVVLGFVLVALVDAGMRWHRADGVERLQFRWLVLGVAVVLTTMALGQFAPDGWGDATAILTFALFNAIPVSIYIAVTRHGLYDIGRVFSRAVSYAVSIGLAIALYAGVVVTASSLVHTDSHLPVALATLAAAAAFLPLLRWVERGLDRHFDRAHYDAEQVVDTFGRRLRDGADPHTTAPALADAVQQTLQPTSLGVWTR